MGSQYYSNDTAFDQLLLRCTNFGAIDCISAAKLKKGDSVFVVLPSSARNDRADIWRYEFIACDKAEATMTFRTPTHVAIFFTWNALNMWREWSVNSGIGRCFFTFEMAKRYTDAIADAARA